MSRFLRLFRIIAIAFLCVFGMHTVALARCSSGNPGSFIITTTNLSAGDKVEFYIEPKGTFTVTWDNEGSTTHVNTGDGNGSDMVGYYFSHTFQSGGHKDITVTGCATDYHQYFFDGWNWDWVPFNWRDHHAYASYTIVFAAMGTHNTPTKIQNITGSLGDVFPTRSGGDRNDPYFTDAFRGCTNFTLRDKYGNLNANLFGPEVTSTKASMFSRTFADSGVDEIPENLFYYIYGPACNTSGIDEAESLFAHTFANTPITSIPQDLFKYRSTGRGIRCSGKYMFEGTFEGCQGLTQWNSIPQKLFSQIGKNDTNGGPRYGMFKRTFADTNIGDTTLKHAAGYSNGTINLSNNLFPSGSADYLYQETFAGNTGLRNLDFRIFPNADLTENAGGMFEKTFMDTNITRAGSCSGYTDNVFGNLGTATGNEWKTDAIFRSTFKNSTIKSVTNNLFGLYKGGGTQAFASTFENCANLKNDNPPSSCSSLTTSHSWVPHNLFGQVSSSANGLFYSTFKDSGLQTIPSYNGSSLFATLTGTGANNMFYWTFYNTPVTSVPKDLFRISSVGDDTFHGTFAFCSHIGDGINGKLNANNDPIIKPSSLSVNNVGGDYPSHGYLAFARMFEGCSHLTDISSNIIRPVASFKDAMFYRTFAKTGVTSVPSGMFSTSNKAPAKYLFRETFAGCPNLQSVANNIFSNMSGAPQDGMFWGTFQELDCDTYGNCAKSCGLNTDFSDLGANFFGMSTGHVAGAPRPSVFKNTFKGCRGLTGQIPAHLFYNLNGDPGATFKQSGLWDDIDNYKPYAYQNNVPVGTSLFEGTFRGTGVTGVLNNDTFIGVSGTPAPSIFRQTFKGCTGLQRIGSDVRDTVFYLSGAPATSMFEGTFDGCSGLSQSLSSRWFGNISGPLANYAYKNTFRNCTGLTGDIPTPTESSGSGGSMSGPLAVKKMFGDVTGDAAGAFVGTFQGCTGLTGFVPKAVFSGISASAGSNSYTFGQIFDGATNMVTDCYNAGYAPSTSADRCHSFETVSAWGNGNSSEIVRCCGDELRSITYNPRSSTAINASTGTSTPEMTYVAEGDTFTALPIGTFENDGYLMSRWDWREGFGYDEPNHALVPQTQYTYDVEVDTVVEPDWEQCTCNYGNDSGVADCEVHTVNETVNSVVTNRCDLKVKCKPGWVDPTWKCDGVKCGASCSRGIYNITLDYNGGTPAGGTSYVVGHVSGENTLIGHIFLKYGDGFYPTSADASAGTNKLNNLGGTESAFSTNYMPGPVDNKPYQGFYGAYVAQAQQGTSTRGGVGVTDAEIQIVNRQGGFNSTTFTTSDTTITARYGDPIYTLTFDDAGGYNGSSQIFLRYSSMAASGPFTPHFYENYEDAYRETNEISRVTIPENPGYRFDGYYLPRDNYTASKTGPAFDSSGFVVSSQFVTSATVPGPKRITDDVTLTAQWSAKFLPVCLDHNGATNASSFHDKVWLEYNTDYYSDNGVGYDSVIHFVDVRGDDGSVIPQKTGYVFNGYLGPEQGAIRDGGTSSTSNFPLVVNAGGKFINKNFTTDEGIKDCDCKKDSSNVCPNFITADWSKEIYEISLDDNGGSGGSPSKFYLWYANDFYSNAAATNQLSEVTIPTREGYTFGGYYNGESCDTDIVAITDCAQIIDANGRVSARNTFTRADTTIYAKWTPNVYEITVNDNCGDTVCLTSGSPTTLYLKYDNGWYRTRAAAEAGTNQIGAMDTIPTRTGYSFEGYRHTSISNRSGGSSGNGGTQSMTITQVTDNQGRFASNTFTTEDTTIDANWVGACNLIALDSNGGTSGNVRKLFKRTGGTAWYMDDTCSVQYTTTEDVIPTKQNYRFRGFFSTLVTPDVEANADTEGLTQYMMTNGALSYDGYNLVVSGPTIIYAAWARECNTIDPGTCTLDVTLGGIVTYTLDCPDGYTEHGEGTYNPYCTAGCYPILLDNQTRGGTTTNSYLYKFGGGTDATKWYRDDECTTEVTSTPAPSKLNATFNGYYYIPISHDEDVESINTRSGGETTTRTQVGTAADPSVLSDEWTVTGPETIYAYYNCNQNYTNSGIDIAGVCANSVYEITLDDNGGDNGNGYVYEKYAEGWSLDPRAAVFNTTTLTSLPTYTDYVFRGYYSAQLAPLTATGNTGTLVIKKDGTLPTSSTLYQDDDTVYAAWARDCVSPVSHGACTLVVADDGAVEYTTTCDTGYSLTSGGGTYNPVCTVNTYTVTYQLNQGNSSVTPSHAGTHPATYTIEDTFTITDPTMTGYTFTGWDVATAPTAWGAGQTSVSGDTNFTVAVGTYGNIVFRATWTANTNTPYTVNHYTKNLNDNNYTLNSTDNLTGTSDASVTLASLTHSITGFNYVEGFVGTTTSHPGTTKPSSGAVTSTTILPDGTRVIDLYYNRAEYTIRFKMGDTVAATQSCTYGATVALTQSDTMTTNLPEGFPVVENGWRFYGWANTYNRNVQDYADGANITCNDDITLYAILHRNVTFKYGDSASATTLTTSTRTQSYYNTDATTAGVDGVETYPLYTQSTYHWAPQGWVLNSGTGTSVSVSQTGATTTTATPAANVDAVYSALYRRTATVVYNSNGNTGGTTPNTTVDQYYNVGASSDAAITANVTLATNGFTRTGYHFVKWAAGDVVGPLVAPGDVYPFPNTAWASSDTYTVYAIWLPDTYNITYTMNGGTPAYTQIEYLQTDGTSYIDTGFVPSADYVHELKFNLASTPSASKYICGTSSTNGRSGNVRVTTAKKIDGIYIGTSGAVSILNASTAVPDSVNTLILDLRNNATSYAYLNNTKISKVISSTITSTESLRLGTSTAGSGGTPIKIYGDTITQNGVVIHNFVPARRNSDDVLGLYDTITGTFKTNAAGSGAFSTGTETDIGPLPSTYTYGIGATVAAGEPTRAYSVFDGWTGTDVSTPTASVTIGTTATGDKAYTANWSCENGYSPNTGNTACEPNTYTITFKTANSTMATQSCTYGESVTLTAESGMSNDTLTGAHGWSFYGWANNYNRKTKDYDDGAQNVSCTGDMTLYGLWQRNVAFKYYNGATATSTTTSNRTQTYYNTTATVTGVDGVEVYTLATQSTYNWAPQGWVLNSTTGTNTVTVTDNRVTPAANVDANYYALYKRTATITYNANGGTGTVSDTTNDQYFNAGGSNANTLNMTLAANGFTKTGHTFSKWAAGSASGDQYSAGDNFVFPNVAWTSTDSYIMYAIWTANTYTVVYNSNKPSDASSTMSGSTPNSTHTYGVSQALTTNGYTLPGYNFEGWNTLADGTGESYSNNQSVLNLTDENGGTVNLYAVWSKGCLAVTLDPHGTGATAGSVATLYKKADTTGWFSDNTCMTAWTSSTSVKPIRTDWTFRGFYKTAADASDVTATTTGTSRVITHDGATTSTGTSWKITANKTAYAGWARNCAPGTGCNCSLAIGTNGTATYTTTAKTGYTLTSGNGTYAPVCMPNVYDITYTMNGGTPAYTQLEYLQSNGTQYITSDYVVNNKTKLYVRYNPVSVSSTGIVVGVTDTASATQANNGLTRLINPNRVGWGDTTTGSMIDISGGNTVGTWYEAFYDQNRINIDGALVATSATEPGVTWTAGRGLGIFGRNGGTAYPAQVKISNVWAIEDGVPQMNLVPARRNSDNALGMYDTITGTFSVAASGAFTAGNDMGPLPSTYTYGIGATVAAGEPTRAYSVFDGWTGTDVSTPTASVTIGTTATGDKAYTANWSCENGYSPNAGGTACVANTNTPYKVCHYTKNLSGSAYTLDGGACENKTGTSDAAIQLVDQARDIDGFTYDRGFVGTSPMGTTMPSGTAPTQTTISPDGSLVISLYYNRDTYTITVTSGRGVASVAATGWTNSGSATMSKDYLFGSTINLATNSTNVVTPTLKAGYTGSSYSKTSGSGTLSNGVFTVGAGNATITVAATGITAPASVSISGGTTKTYNYQDTTLTVTPTAPSGGYDSGISYKYAYANTATSSSSTCGTYGSYGSYGTSGTTSVSKAAYRGYQCYKAKVVATDGTLTSAATETSSGTTMGLINRTITFDKNTGTLSGTSPLYAAYGDAKLYTSATNTTEGSVPSASKTGYTFKGWYTASSAGSQVYNASGVLQASVSGYTNGSAQWIATANKTLYAQYDINTYTIAYDLKGGDAPSGNDYIPVEYIASTSGGNQYIDTLYKLQTNNVIYNWTARDDSGSGTSLFGAQGSQDGGTRYTGILYGSKSSRSVYTGSSTGGAIGYVSSDSAYHDWELHAGEGTVSLTKDGTQVGSVAYNGNLYKGKNIVLFGNRTGTTGATQYMLGTFKHFSIIDNGTLAFNGIPVRQISTDKCGLYDTVSGTFFSSASGTEFDCPTESARPTSVEYNEIFGVIQPTRPHSTFTGWNLANMENGITHMKGDTASNLSSFGTGTTYNGTTETYYQNLRATNGTVTFTATWSCDVGYTSNAAGTSCDAVNYPMQYTCSDGADGYTFSTPAPSNQTAHYLVTAPFGQNVTLPSANSCQKIYGQGTSEYCADCFDLVGWNVDAEVTALSSQTLEPHAAGGTIPTWGRTNNVNWCKVGNLNTDWGNISGDCDGGLSGDSFMLRPKYTPKTYTISYMYATSTGPDQSGKRPDSHTYTMFTNISGDDLSLTHGSFVGWCPDDPTLTTCTGPDTSVGPRNYGNHTYYAKWACDAGYSLSYDANDNPVCTAVSITCSAGYYLPASGTSSADCASCPAGKYCLGGTWTYDGTEKGIDGNVGAGYYAVGGCKVQNPSTSSDYITGGECAPCGGNWTSNAGAQAHTACYRNIVLDKNGMSGTLTLPSNSGCKSIGGATGSTNDTLVVYYNTTCKLPTTVLTGTATGTTYTSTGTWATSANAASGFVTTIKTTSTNVTITQYAGKIYTCAPGYYLTANTNGACSVCTAGNYCPGDSFMFDEDDDQGINTCPAGSFCPAGVANHTLCAIGSYTATTGQSACSACQNGTTTSATGQTSCNATCANATGAMAWDVATWQTNNTVNNLCVLNRCEAGYYPLVNNSGNACSLCAGFADGLYPRSVSTGVTVASVSANYSGDGRRACFLFKKDINGYHIAEAYDEFKTPCPAGTYTNYPYEHTAAVHYGESYACETCPANTYSGTGATSCDSCLTNYVAPAGSTSVSDCLIHCDGGYYIEAANDTECSAVGVGHWAAESWTIQGQSGSYTNCSGGLTTIGYGVGADEAADCGRILHVGDNHLYLRSAIKTQPSLHVKIGNTVLYGNMADTIVNMSDNIDHSLKMKFDNTVYSVYDDSGEAYISDSGGSSSITLSPGTAATSFSPATYNTANGLNWSAVFDGVTLAGVGACDATEVASRTIADANFVPGGTGTQCWCQITSPVQSTRWVTPNKASSAALCAQKCGYFCASNVGGSSNNNVNFKTKLYSVSNITY